MIMSQLLGKALPDSIHTDKIHVEAVLFPFREVGEVYRVNA